MGFHQLSSSEEMARTFIPARSVITATCFHLSARRRQNQISHGQMATFIDSCLGDE
jgi:hypothetical protein